MADKDSDIVTDILQRAIEVVRAELGPAVLDRVTVEALVLRIGALDRPVRQHWRAVVPQRAPAAVDAAKRAALDEVRRTGQVAVAATRHGIGRATLYRLMKSRNSHTP